MTDKIGWGKFPSCKLCFASFDEIRQRYVETSVAYIGSNKIISRSPHFDAKLEQWMSMISCAMSIF